MSIEKVKEFFKEKGITNPILEFDVSSATVELAARALGIDGKYIAKSMSFKKPTGGAVLVVLAGDVKTDNAKFKSTFGYKATMLKPDEVTEYIGHNIGGVCPFAIPEDVDIFLDKSLLRFEYVYPACGSSNSAVKMTPTELFEYSSATGWVDVSKQKETP